MNLLKIIWQKVSSSIFAASLPVFVVLIPILQGLYYSGADTADLFYVLKRWFWNTWVEEGSLPFWNPGVSMGIYQIASPAHEIFSPLTSPFYWIFSGYGAAHASIVFASALAAVGVERLMRALSLPTLLCVGCSWIYCLSGPISSLIDRSPIYLGMCLYPWVGLNLVQLLRTTSLKNLAWLALCLALLVHHGDWISYVYFLGVSGFFIFIYFYKKPLQAIFLSFGLSTISFLLSAIVFLPTASNIAFTDRAGGFDYDHASYFSLHFYRILQLVSPGLWGQTYDLSFWGHEVASTFFPPRFWYFSLYLGTTTLLLAAYGLWTTRKKPTVQVLFLVGCICFWISLGRFFPVHAFLFENVGAYSRLRYPEKFFLYLELALIVLATLGLKNLTKIPRFQIAKFWKILFLLHFIGVLILWFFFSPIENQVREYSQDQAYTSILLQSIFAIAAILLAKIGERVPWVWSPSALVMFAVLEVLAFRPPSLTNSEAHFKINPHFRKLMLTPKSHNYRVLYDNTLFYVGVPTQTALTPNWGILEGYQYSNGYETIVPQRTGQIHFDQIYSELPIWSRVLNLKYQLTRMARDSDLKKWSDLGYLKPIWMSKIDNLVLLELSRDPKPVEWSDNVILEKTSEAAIERLQKRGDSSQPVVVEENEIYFGGGKALDTFGKEFLEGLVGLKLRKHTLDGLAQKIEQIEKRTGLRKWHLTNSEPGFFLNRENFHVGWRAKIDGKEVPIVRADFMNFGTYVPAGEHNVEFEFVPPGWKLGSTLTIIGLFLFALLLLLSGKNFQPWKRNAS